MRMLKRTVPPFSVLSWTNRDRVTVLNVVGDLDFYTAPLLQWQLLQLASTPSTVIVLDLAGMSFVDSSGISLLIFGSKRVRAEGKQLRLAALSTRTHDVLDRMCVLKLFDIFDTVEQAVTCTSGLIETPPGRCEALPKPQSA